MHKNGHHLKTFRAVVRVSVSASIARCPKNSSPGQNPRKLNEDGVNVCNSPQLPTATICVKTLLIYSRSGNYFSAFFYNFCNLFNHCLMI